VTTEEPSSCAEMLMTLVRSDLAVALHTALAAAGIELALSVLRELT